jgi:hypothetical protein
MINNPIALKINHISTADNIVADKLLQIPSKTHLLLHFPRIQQAHPALVGCQCFIPGSTLISAITAAILQAECIHPVAVNRHIRTMPGKIITSNGAAP